MACALAAPARKDASFRIKGGSRDLSLEFSRRAHLASHGVAPAYHNVRALMTAEPIEIQAQFAVYLS
jgi:hypothetical protein